MTAVAAVTVAAAPGRFLTVGQPVAERLARRILADGSGPATLLVHGPQGSGKGTFLDDLLALALCETSAADERPCNTCVGCRRARAHSHPDLVMASPDRWREDRGGGESIVAAARRWLAEVAGAPIAGRWRVIVIERADDANEQVQNALLKALEEPADRQLFILVADDVRRILPTIRSRAWSLRVGPVPREQLAQWLVARAQIPEEQAATLARLAEGRIGQALAYADAPERVDWRRRTQHELVALLERGRAERLAAVRELLDDAARIGPRTGQVTDGTGDEAAASSPTSVQRQAAIAILDAWIDLARDCSVVAAGAGQLAVATELVPDLPAAAARLGAASWATATNVLQRIRDALEENVSPRLALEVAMLAWPQLPVR